MDLMCLFCNYISWWCIFAGAPFGTRHNSGSYLFFLAAFPGEKLLYYILIPQSKLFRDFALRFPRCYHFSYLWQQYLHMCIPFSGHDNTP